MDKEKYLKMYSNYQKMVTDKVSQIVNYNWKLEASINELKIVYSKLIKEFKGIDFFNFTIDELRKLGFNWFDEDLLCMPIWVIDCLPYDIELTSISGNKTIYSEGMTLNKEVRYGITAYGFTKSQLRDNTINNILN